MKISLVLLSILLISSTSKTYLINKEIEVKQTQIDSLKLKIDYKNGTR